MPRDADADATEPDRVEVVPLAEEQLQVHKTARQTGRVIVETHVRERTEVIDEPLLREEVDVRRVPVGRVVDTAPPVREEGDTTIIPVIEERLVVRTELVLKEELHVTRRRTAVRTPREVTLRYEEAEVRREPE